MKMPRYIVIKLEMVGKDTVKATEITDRCEVYEYEADEDELQTDCNKLINEVVKLDMSREDKFKVMDLLEKNCEKCKHYLFTDIDGYYCKHETYGQPCSCEPKTVDAVEVVRCRDCKFYQPYDYHRKYDCSRGLLGVMGDDYCSHGERRE